jgi:toxin ParE1/3/4
MSEDAIDDLSSIGRWIADQADLDTSNAYVARIEAACGRLSYFPNRGTPRPDLAPGLRTIPFERRYTIGYQVESEEVIILRIIHGARDFAKTFRG